MKERYAHLGLLAVAAAIVLYLLLHRSAAVASNGSQISDEQIGQQPGYPNGSPLKMGDIQIGPSPTNIIYNNVPDNPILPHVMVGAGGAGSCPCDFNPCAAVQELAYTDKIDPKIIDSAAANFAIYQQKLTSSFAQAPSEAVNF